VCRKVKEVKLKEGRDKYEWYISEVAISDLIVHVCKGMVPYWK